MGANISQSRLDFSNSVRIPGGLRFCQKLHALAIGSKHNIKKTLRAVRCFLRETANASPRGQQDVAVLRRDLAGDGAEQRCLTRAVAPNKTDPSAVRNASRGALKQELAGDPQSDVVDHEHGRFLAEAADSGNPYSLLRTIAARHNLVGVGSSTRIIREALCVFAAARKPCIMRSRGAGSFGEA